MSQECICDFCQWRGCVAIGQTICPHCKEDGWLIPADEWVLPENRPENRQTIYSVIQELNNDTPEIKEAEDS